MKVDTLKRLNAARAARRAAVLVTDLSGGPERLVEEADLPALERDDPALAAEIAGRLRSGKSGRARPGERDLFLNVSVPPARLVMVGAVHISQALAPMAAAAGFDVLIVDPRTAFATEERFAGVRLLPEWPQDVMDDLAFDRHTACAALTHDPKIDDPALKAALAADCFYVGALGSRKTHGKRRERLLAEGVPEEALSRIHAPIGLPIGAASPAEIAVAVLAEVIAARRLGSGAAAPAPAPATAA